MSQKRESLDASIRFFRDLSNSKIRFLPGYPLVTETFLEIIGAQQSFPILKKLTFYPIANLNVKTQTIEQLIKGLRFKKFLRVLILSATETSITDLEIKSFNELLAGCAQLKSVHMNIGDKNIIKN